MSGRLKLSRAARDLTPLQQGELDSMCGLYAIINGIRVALYPAYKFDKRTLSDLFVHGTAQLSRLGKLREAMAAGMDETLLLRLCSVVTARATYLSGLRIGSCAASGPEVSWNTRSAIQRVKHCLKQGQPVVIAFEGKLDHWTVVIAYSATRLYLFDSAGYHWVSIKSVTASSRALNKLYRISKASTIVLESAPNPIAASLKTGDRGVSSKRQN